MTGNRTKLSLELLPKDIAEYVMTPKYINLKDLVALAKINTVKTLFQKPLTVAKLLDFVTQTNNAEAEKIINIAPALMFQHVQLRYSTNEPESISPLKCALKFYNTDIGKLFWMKIKNYPEYVQHFKKQIQEQKEHIDLESFFSAYTNYGLQYNLWSEQKISDQEIDQAWLQVGVKQRELLVSPARHILMKLCSKIQLNNGESKVDDPIVPQPESYGAYDNLTGAWISLSAPYSISRLGKDFSLLLAGDTAIARGVGHRPRAVDAAFDSAKIRGLYEAKIKDLVTMISELEQSSKNEELADVNPLYHR